MEKHLADLNGYRPYENFRYIRKRNDGSICHITSLGRPIFDGHGKFQGYIGTAEDITCQVKTEEKIRSAETILMTAINSLEVIFAIWDSDDRLVFENEFFASLTKVSSNHEMSARRLKNILMQLLNMILLVTSKTLMQGS